MMMLQATPVTQTEHTAQVAGERFPDIKVQICAPQQVAANLIIVPGWKSSGTRPLFIQMAAKYADSGIATLRYDPAYYVDPQHLSIHRVVEEIHALTNFATTNLSPKTILFGASLGALSIGAFLSERPDFLPAAVILRAGAPSSKKFGDLGAIDPVGRLVEISCPLLLLHGDSDKTVPIQLSEDLAERRATKGLPATFIKQAGFGHSVRDSEIDAIVYDVGRFIGSQALKKA